ncbi:MAG: hypothetical protein EBY38_07145 [Flavobacteriaceae bacterium]|nr:hypothetical protein [Flavobacteriaceae bacterium]
MKPEKNSWLTLNHIRRFKRLIYSNLKNVSVKNGQTVSPKQTLGTLLTKGAYSICHFEIHYISNGVPQTKNPSLWLSR